MAELSKAFALAVPHEEALRIRDDVGFFQAVRVRRKPNVVQARSFAEHLEQALLRYQNRAVKPAQVIEDLIALACEMRAAEARGEELGLSDDELAFYDALETNDSAVAVLGDETLKTIARELVATVRKNATIDWTVRENVRAGLRVYVKRILRKYGNPPDKQERATRTVLEQAEVLSEGTTRSVKKPARGILRLTGRPCRYNIVGTKEAGMIKTLQKHGNSQALVIDKGIMEALGIDLDSPLQITVSGNSLIVTPVHVGIGREAVAEAIAELRPKYGKMLERLAK